MNFKTLCEVYNPELHYDPEKALRKIELAIEKEKEKIESIEKTYANIDFYPREKNDKGRFVHAQKTKDEVKKWKKILAEHKALVKKYEKELIQYKKDADDMKVDEDLGESLKSVASAVTGKVTEFARNRAKSIKQMWKKRVKQDERNVREKETAVRNLEKTKQAATKIGGKKWEEDNEALKKAKKELKVAKKSTLKYGLTRKLPRRLAALFGIIMILSSMTKPFMNPNPLTKEMNEKTIINELAILDGILAEMNPQILNDINASDRLEAKRDEFTEIYKTIKFNDKSLPATKADWDKAGKLIPQIRETANKELANIDLKAGKNIATTSTRKLINMIRAAGDVWNAIQVSVGWGDRYNPRSEM